MSVQKARIKTRVAVLRVITEYGPLSVSEIAGVLGLKREVVTSHVANMHRASPKQIHVADHHICTGRGKDARLWAAGDKSDAPPPEPSIHLGYSERERRERAEAETEARALARRAALIRPYRDPMVFLTAGRAP